MTRWPAALAPVTAKVLFVGLYHNSSAPCDCASCVTIEPFPPFPAGLSTTGPAFEQPTMRFPFAPSPSPDGAQALTPIEVKLNWRSGVPVSEYSCTPPASERLVRFG